MNKRESQWLRIGVIGMLTGFLLVTGGTIIYMGKDYNTYNLVYSFFGINTHMRIWLANLPIGQGMLLRLANIGSALLFLSVFGYALQISFYIRKGFKKFGLTLGIILMITQCVLLDPGIIIRVYMAGSWIFKDIQTFRSVYHWLPLLYRYYGYAISIVSFILLLGTLRSAKKPRAGTYIIVLFFGGMIGIYQYLYYWFPCNSIWMSRVAGYVQYNSFPLPRSVAMAPALLVVIVFLLGGIILFTMRYVAVSSHYQQREIEFQNKINTVEISSRVFCHYLKNELLEQQVELEMIMPKLPEELLPDIMQIMERNRDVFERLNSLRAMFRQRKIVHKPLDMVQFLRDMESEIRKLLPETELIFQLPTGRHPLIVLGSTIHLSEALCCILRNANDAMQNIAQRFVVLSLESKRNYVMLSVANNGEQLPKENIGKIFDPFFSTKPIAQNWGIGLSLCKSIICMHQGKINVDQVKYQKVEMTRFVIMLPEMFTEEDQMK